MKIDGKFEAIKSGNVDEIHVSFVCDTLWTKKISLKFHFIKLFNFICTRKGKNNNLKSLKITQDVRGSRPFLEIKILICAQRKNS